MTPGGAPGSAAAAPPQPELRAAMMRLYLLPTLRCDPALRSAAREALPEETIGRIERASASAWLPLSWEIAILRAAHAQGGDEAVRALARAVGRAGLDVPLVRVLLTATLGMLARRREAQVRFLFASHDVTMRNAGRTGAVVGHGRVVTLAHEDIPAAAWDRTVNLRNCGAIESVELRGTAPRAEVEWTEGSSRAVYTLTWP